jgi:hypothetical protein
MKTYRNRMAGMAAFALIVISANAGPAAGQAVMQIKFTIAPEMSCQGATPREEALLRHEIQVMHPEVLPLRVIFVPHWKYVATTRIYHLHVPTGYTSAMFTHLPSRTVFIDADRYVSDDSFGYWMAHELGHLVTNSVKEADAERAAAAYRKRLKAVRHELALQKISFSAN